MVFFYSADSNFLYEHIPKIDAIFENTFNMTIRIGQFLEKILVTLSLYIRIEAKKCIPLYSRQKTMKDTI